MNELNQFFSIKRVLSKVSPETATEWLEFTKEFFLKNVKEFNFARVANNPSVNGAGDIMIKLIVKSYITISPETMKLISNYYPSGTQFVVRSSFQERSGNLSANHVDTVTEIFLKIPNSGTGKRVNIPKIYIKILKHFLLFLLIAIVAYFHWDLGTISY
jgi:hypothetical protein